MPAETLNAIVWDPDDQNLSSPGIITISEDRYVSLTLLPGTLSIALSRELFLKKRCLVAAPEDKGVITLMDCISEERQQCSNGYNGVKVSVEYAFRSTEIAKYPYPDTYQGRFYYEGFEEWFFFEQPIKANLTGHISTIELRQNPLFRSRLADGLEAIHNFNHCIKHSSRPKNALTFSCEDGIYFESERKRPLTEFLDLELKFRYLINILADCDLKIIKEEASDGLRENRSFTLLRRQNIPSIRGSRPHLNYAPIQFTEIKDIFWSILETWYVNYSSYKECIQLFTLVRHNTTLDIDNTFTLLMQALEAFHNGFIGGGYMDNESYARNVKPVLDAAIPADLAEDFSNRLKSSIKYGNRYSLRTRLKQIIRYLPAGDNFTRLKKLELVGLTVDTRNFLSHRDESIPIGQRLQGRELLEAIYYWQEVLLIALLKSLGLSDKNLDIAVQRLSLSGPKII